MPETRLFSLTMAFLFLFLVYVRRRSLEVFNLSACAANTLICPVDCLGQYVFRSDFLRNANNQSKLFIGLRKPHRQVSGSTVGRWVKDYLSLAGVNSLVFSAHSTWGAASSKAASTGVPIDSILATASWSSQSTFARFYHRSLDTPTVTGAVFNSLERPVL